MKEIPIKKNRKPLQAKSNFPSVRKNDGMALSSAIMGVISPGES
jgi:hypothetical protein